MEVEIDLVRRGDRNRQRVGAIETDIWREGGRNRYREREIETDTQRKGDRNKYRERETEKFFFFSGELKTLIRQKGSKILIGFFFTRSVAKFILMNTKYLLHLKSITSHTGQSVSCILCTPPIIKQSKTRKSKSTEKKIQRGNKRL